MKYFLLSTIILISFFNDVNAQQQVLAGEMHITERRDDTISIEVRLFTELDTTTQDNPILIRWGDGYTDTIRVTYIAPVNEDIQMEVYEAEHIYDFWSWPSLLHLYIRVDFLPLSSTITNYSSNILDNEYIGVRYSPVATFPPNTIPSYQSSNYAITTYITDTAIIHPINLNGMQGDSLGIDIEFGITDSNYIYPASPTDFEIRDSLVIWKYPQQVGRYIFLLRVKEFFTANFYRTDFLRIVMIEVDSAFNVNTYQPQLNSQWFKTYPNPTTSQLIINYQGLDFKPYPMEIYNASGQLIQSKLLSNPREEISIGDLPTGIYILKARINGVDYVNKIVKQ